MVLAAAFSPGHLHPLLVHLPIGFLYLVGILVVAGLWKRTDAYRPAIQLSLGVAFWASVGAIATGWLMAGDGGYAEEVLSRHKWLGIATAGVTLLLWLLARMQLRSRPLFAGLTLIALVLLTLTGHLGGEMTHGKDFLFAPTSEPAPVVQDVSTALLYPDIIAPVLQSKCASCHNDQKQKGGLNLASFAALQAGGDHGSVLATDASEPAELLRRILLPGSDEKHMPPEGKTPLTPDETTLLRWWLESGACPDCPTQTLAGFTEHEATLNAAVSTGKGTNGATPEQLAALRANEVDVSWASESHPVLGLSLEHRATISPSTLDALEDVQAYVGYLNLAGSTLSEDLLEIIAGMPQLRQLMLQNSSVTDQDLAQLADLKTLEVLNLYGTAVGDQSASTLRGFSQLQRVYTWQSGWSPAGIAQVQEALPALTVVGEAEADLFPPSELKPPSITAAQALFDTQTEVTLASTIPGAVIRFTTDGTLPDDQAPVYDGPFAASSTQRIQAIAEKPGWVTSAAASMQVFKAAPAPQSVSLKRPPAEAYSANGPSSLTDRTFGELGIFNGLWLGYQGQPLTAFLEYDSPRELSKVYVSTLSNPGSWVFFPKGIVVWTSDDGKRYRKAGEASFEVLQRFGEEHGCFSVNIDAPATRFVKVEVQSVGRNPSWHPSPGQKAWLFVDELFVE